MNYTMQEYANDVVYAIKEICDADNVPHPNIVSESGRAIAAHHSVLVVNVLGVTEFDTNVPGAAARSPAPPLVTNMWETYQGVSQKNLLESYHDAVEYKDQVLQLFNLGHLSLEHRVLCENLFWAICEKVLMLVRGQRARARGARGPREGARRTRTSATSRCSSRCPTRGRSISCSRSARSTASTRSRRGARRSPTSRATPTARSIRSSICATSSTCSSCTPSPKASDYYLGIFLVGAYQEILGDLHNLFGDTNTVHVQLSPEGDYDVKEVVAGDTVSEVLQFVDYSPSDLLGRMRNNVEQALRKKLMTIEESRTLINRFRQGMIGYTYLDRRNDRAVRVERGTPDVVATLPILEEVLKLPEEERAELAARILDSLEDSDVVEPGHEAAWTQVIERRIREARSDRTKVGEMTDAMARVRAALAAFKR